MTNSKPIQFLGIAEHYRVGAQPFPYGGVDLFQLAHHKIHIFYPGLISGHAWMLLVDPRYLDTLDLSKWMLRIVHEDGGEVGNTVVQKATKIDDIVRLPSSNEVADRKGPSPTNAGNTDQTLAPNQNHFGIAFPVNSEFVLFPIIFSNCTINSPGKCTIQSIYDGKVEEIGVVEFHYRPTPSLTLDQIRAIEAQPAARRICQVEIGCKFCPTKLRAYVGLERSRKLEKQGVAWYAELQDEFVCSCGKARISLKYIRESGHGMLLNMSVLEGGGISYTRQYSHNQIKNLASTFIETLNANSTEAPIQSFIEKNPVLLARFNAKRLFVKPSILGKHIADFAILDQQGVLWLIELERPSIKLFREKDGHSTADLMHAYNQVVDWMYRYQKHRSAVFDTLGLQESEVLHVRGVVIAGRSGDVSHATLARHLANPPYPNIEFQTLDDLAFSMVNLSAKLT